MRWVTYAVPSGSRVALVQGEELLALEADITLEGLLRDGALEEAAHDVTRRPAEVRRLDEVQLLAPLRPPSLRDCVGFLGHIENCRAGLPGQTPEVWAQAPHFYFGNPGSCIGANEDVEIFPGCEQFDYEVEVGLVVGRGGRDLHPDRAAAHVAGLVLMVDWSARDLQAWTAPTTLGPGKGKDGATTLGPFFVTVDELEQRRSGGAYDLDMRAWRNGVELGGGSMAQMDFSIGELLAYTSRGCDLVPGDVIGSGTVPTGCLRELSRLSPESFQGWLAPGDEIVVRVDLLGQTRQRIVAGPPPIPLHTGY